MFAPPGDPYDWTLDYPTLGAASGVATNLRAARRAVEAAYLRASGPGGESVDPTPIPSTVGSAPPGLHSRGEST